MSVITKDLGVATAYGYAKSKGYTGTEEEFAELMASYANVAQQAEAAAQDAEDAKDEAVTAKTDAQTAKTAAQAAQSAAETASGAASTKASEAAQSAQAASGSATAAQTSATAAAGSAQTAQAAAQTATTKASEASSSASAASTAKTGAETARTGAQTAQTAAETAQANAEAAASSVSASAAQIEQNTEDITGLKNDFTQLEDKVEDAYNAYVTETETGAIASFTDGADDVPVKDLTVAIEPVQSGSGDPSPTNIRPISGWTGANVTRTGKNLLTTNAKWYYNDNMFYGNHTNNNMPDGTFILPAGTYTASSSETMTGIYTFDETGTSCGLVYNNTKLTFVNPKTQKFLVKFYKASTTEQEFANINLQLEVGSTATAYEPYQGETCEVDWTTEAGTVYGGTLDVTTGVLTVDTTRYKFTGSEAYTQLSGSVAIKTGLVLKSTGDGYCTDFEFNGTGSTNFIYLKTTLTAEDLKTYMGNHDVYAVVVLAQAQTYQLTAHEVSTILGQNNIFADTGNSTVQYRADTKLYIDKVLNA